MMMMMMMMMMMCFFFSDPAVYMLRRRDVPSRPPRSRRHGERSEGCRVVPREWLSQGAGVCLQTEWNLRLFHLAFDEVWEGLPRARPASRTSGCTCMHPMADVRLQRMPSPTFSVRRPSADHRGSRPRWCHHRALVSLSNGQQAKGLSQDGYG